MDKFFNESARDSPLFRLKDPTCNLTQFVPKTLVSTGCKSACLECISFANFFLIPFIAIKV